MKTLGVIVHCIIMISLIGGTYYYHARASLLESHIKTSITFKIGKKKFKCYSNRVIRFTIPITGNYSHKISSINKDSRLTKME